MKTIFLCAIFTVIIGTSMAIVCTKDICNNFPCNNAPQKEGDCQSGQIFVSKGGFCGCCNSCERALGYGESCANKFRGSPPTATCTPPLVCDPTTAVCTNPDPAPFVPSNSEPSNEGCQSSASSYASSYASSDDVLTY